MKKIAQKSFLGFLILTMCLPLIGLVFGVKNENVENRQLRNFPQLSPNFTIEFEGFWQDQFPFRNQMITLYNQLNQKAFNYSGNSQVIYGKDDMLFFSETLDEFQNSRPFSESELLKIQNNFNLVNKTLRENGTDLTLMVIPNKNEIYSDKMPDHISAVSKIDNFDNVNNLNFDFKVINLKEEFINNPHQIYHNYDSHYNNLGAALTADRIIETITKKESEYAQQEFTLTQDFISDLTTMLYPSSVIYDQNMDYQLKQDYIHLRPLQSVDDITIQTLNEKEEDNLYFIRDSFGRALIPFISNAFNQVHYSRISPYYFQEAINLEFDHVLVEIAQRNMFHWLKGTPVIEISAEDIQIETTQAAPLEVTIHQEDKHQMKFSNVRIEDQELAHHMTQAYITNGEISYPVFMILDSGEFINRDFDYGFSLYTQEEIDFTTMSLIYQRDNQWVQSQLSHQQP